MSRKSRFWSFQGSIGLTQPVGYLISGRRRLTTTLTTLRVKNGGPHQGLGEMSRGFRDSLGLTFSTRFIINLLTIHITSQKIVRVIAKKSVLLRSNTLLRSIDRIHNILQNILETGDGWSKVPVGG